MCKTLFVTFVCYFDCYCHLYHLILWLLNFLEFDDLKKRKCIICIHNQRVNVLNLIKLDNL